MTAKIEKRTRDPEKTRANILEVAFGEIYHHGFQGVSIDRIIRETEVTKGAFFHHFASKSELGYALVDEVLREMILERWIRPLAAYRNPLQGILKRFKLLTERMDESDLARGCPLNNLAQEMSAVDPRFREKIRAVMTLWIDETERYLQKAQQGGYLQPGVDTRQLAVFIVMFEEGAFGLVKSLADRKIFESLYGSLRNHLLSVGGKGTT
jgi:TetR/AcrR family transcriptional regulator, transcriptional repressor for nem operon